MVWIKNKVLFFTDLDPMSMDIDSLRPAYHKYMRIQLILTSKDR